MIIESDQPVSRISDDEGQSSGIEEEEFATVTNMSRSSPLVLSRLLSRSRGSLLIEDNVKSDKSINQPIILPKDFNDLYISSPRLAVSLLLLRNVSTITLQAILCRVAKKE